MGEFVKAASTSEIAPGHSHLVVLKGKEIVLFNIDGEFFALMKRVRLPKARSRVTR